MVKFTKFFACLALIVLAFASPVFANEVSLSDDSTTLNIVSSTPATTSTPLETPTVINEDLLINNDDSYTLNSILYGNAFISTNSLTVDSTNNGGTIFGDLFASTVNTTIKSDLVYSDSKDKIGNYLIDSTKSYSVINGNVYIMASDTFTLESKCEIHGDLYVFANVVNIEPDAVVSGNIFVFANTTLNLHGKVSGSVYAKTANFNMNYTGYVSKDLLLSTNDANISGKIDRYTKINSESGKVVTSSDFITAKDLEVEALDFQFAGEVQGNATISSKALTFDNSKTCIIRGNLDYATNSEITIPDGIVTGEATSSNYINKNSFAYILLEKVISYISLLIYVFVVGLIFKRISPNFIEKLSNITTSNLLISLGLGLILFLLLIPFLILFIFIRFTALIGVLLLISVLFISAIAVPLFIVSIANARKTEKLNVYVKMLIITSILFVVSLLSYFGIVAILIFTLIAIGKILIVLFKKNS